MSLSVLFALAFSASFAATPASDDDFDIELSPTELHRGAVTLDEEADATSDDGDEPDEDEPDDEDPDAASDIPDTAKKPISTTKSTTAAAFKDVDDDFAFEEPVVQAPVAVAVKVPGPLSLDVNGKEPLADNYAVTVVATDTDSIVVELPMLVARSRVGVEKGFLVITEAWIGTTKVSEVRQAFEPASIAEFGPTFAFAKLLAPVNEPKGTVKLVVKRAELDGSGAKELFNKSTPYALK